MFSRLAAACLIAGSSLLSAYAQTPNTLSAQEKKAGWQLLFDGRDLKGWHRYNGKGTPASWKVEQGALHLDVPKTPRVDSPGTTSRDPGDILTDTPVAGDFAFKADFKLERYTNSGVFFFVQENAKYPKIFDTALEVQIGDDDLYQRDVKLPHPHNSGDLFAIADARIKEPKPLGEWNQLEVTMRKNKLVVMVNGYTVQEHDLTSADWKRRVAGSKLSKAPLASGKFNGRIGLQDWNTSVWFRNIKLRNL
ncbi:DUF1080 domain-containing protein [uncultured Spirosoma sp.]|uniref:3-keto-disaccharide hydrolase n=1 Tax=uncultured Spirosoma sp. TaxID=278208 RepID=UPI00258B5149|nr:DUF1080 domain-containing protein [uncultured Spirosoma sp.]